MAFFSYNTINPLINAVKNVLGGRTIQGDAPIHLGSWGMPDIGLTETVKAAESQPGELQQTNYDAPDTSNPYFNPSNFAQNQPVSNNNTQAPTTGDVLGDNNQVTQQPTQADFLKEIENIYAPQASYLNKAEQNLKNDYPNIKSQIEDEYKTSEEQVEHQKTLAGQAISEAEKSAQDRSEDASSAARRLYNELRMGGRQRFGAKSPISEAYQALTAREFQRTQGENRKTLMDTLNKISTQRQNIQKEYGNTLLALDREKRAALSKAQSDFNAKLSQISYQRGLNDSAKSSAKLDLLMQLRNQIFQINLQTMQFQQSLEQQRQSSLAQQDAFEAMALRQTNLASQAVNQAAGTTGFDLNPTSSLSNISSNVDDRNWFQRLIGVQRQNKDEEENK